MSNLHPHGAKPCLFIFSNYIQESPLSSAPKLSLLRPDNLGTKSHPPPREGTQQLALQHGGGHQHPPLSPLCRATLTHWFPSASQAVALLQEQQGFSASPNTTMATTGMSAGEEAVVVSGGDSSLSSSGTKGCSTPTRCPQSSRSQLHFPTSAGILAMPGWQPLS